jgi:hypothetical protein
MQNSLFSLCVPRVSDASRRDTVLDLTDLVNNKIDAAQFFAENYVTDGMRTLIVQTFARLAGQSNQAIFRLRQAMGGGKTHNMLAVGLLAKHPNHIPQIAKEINGAVITDPGMVDVVSFSGRESDEKYGIWGAIAAQLGRLDHFKDNYTPLQAPGQQAWVNLFRGRRVLILIDELAPYLDSTRAVTVGNSDLAAVTVTAMANLFNALQHDDCRHVCLVMGELVGVYEHASQNLDLVLRTIDAESSRLSQSITPVQLNTNELYYILRKRLFQTLPDAATVQAVAMSYATALSHARQMDVTVESPEQFQVNVMQSYPFHPMIRDLYARFRENQGFQQTRGLIRLMRLMVADLWTSGAAKTESLLSAHHLNFNNPAILTEIEQINNTLANAVAHDIASNGTAVAEEIDAELHSTDARDATRLIFMASLSTAANPVLGLGLHEVIGALAAPGRDISQLKSVIVERLMGKAWYLHGTDTGALYFRNVENVTAQLESMVRTFANEQAIEEIKQRLHLMFDPSNSKPCYQRLYVMPALNEIEITLHQVTLVILQPVHGTPTGVGGLPKAVEDFYQQLQYKNRVMFLTGSYNTYQQLIENGKRLRAIRAIKSNLASMSGGNNQVQSQQAQQLEENITQHFYSAVRETFTRLIWPIRSQGDAAQSLFPQEFYMKFEGNNYRGEQQIIQLLREKQKYTEDITTDNFRQKIELRLFTQPQMEWNEIERRAASQTVWQWHLNGALADFRQRMVREGQWREYGAVVAKGPFPKEKTSVAVRLVHRHPDGSVDLEVTRRYGDTLYWDVGGTPTTASQLHEGETFKTNELQVAFLCVDSRNEHETGEVLSWQNEIQVKFADLPVANDKHQLTLIATPKGQVFYTTDESNPLTHGARYDEPLVLSRPPYGNSVVILAAARADGIESAVFRHTVLWDGAVLTIEPQKPAQYVPKSFLKTNDSNQSYKLLNDLEQSNATVCGVKLSVQQPNSDRWSEVGFGDAVNLTPQQIRDTLIVLRDLVPSGDVLIQVRKSISFGMGIDLQRFAESQAIVLKPTEVAQ